MEERYYPDEECEVCGVNRGSRLCDDCKEETDNLFAEFWESLSPAQRMYLEEKADGVYLSDLHERMKK